MNSCWPILENSCFAYVGKQLLEQMLEQLLERQLLEYCLGTFQQLKPYCLRTIERLLIIIKRFIKRCSSAEAEEKGAVHVFNVLAAIILMFKKMSFEPRFKSFQGRRILHIISEAVPRNGFCDRERTVAKLRGKTRYLK